MIVTKKTLLHLLYYSGVLNLFRLLNRHKAVILVYHGISQNVIKGSVRNSAYLHIDADNFKQHMQYLKKNYNVIPLQSLCGIIKNGAKIPDYTVAVTFDDGYRSIFDNAYPILREYGIVCSVFLVSRLMQRDGWLWLDKLEYAVNLTSRECISIFGKTFGLKNKRLKAKFLFFMRRKFKAVCEDKRGKLLDELISNLEVRVPEHPCDEYRLLSYTQARQMNGGIVSFGSHTPEHNILTLENEEMISTLITESKGEISRQLERDINLFSYPNGSYNNRVKEALKQNGFICGLTTNYGMNDSHADLFELKRIPVGSQDTLILFIAHLSGIRKYTSGFMQFLRGAIFK